MLPVDDSGVQDVAHMYLTVALVVFCCASAIYDSGKTDVNMLASIAKISGTDMASLRMPMEHDMKGAFCCFYVVFQRFISQLIAALLLTISCTSSFERGQRSGYGRLDFVETDGTSGHYEGEWLNGLYHGQGKVVYSTWSYVGEWSRGEMHGYGMRMDAAGTLIAKGQWEMGTYIEGSDDHLHYGETEETISEALELD